MRDDLEFHLNAHALERAQRTGPVGRSLRLILAVAVGTLVALRLATFAHRGPTGYRDPSVLTDVSLWTLTVIVVLSLVDFAGRFAPGLERFSPAARRKATIIALVAAIVISAAIGLVLRGAIWGFPLADLWWWLNTAYLVQLALAFGLAALVAAPGCEQGVWRELLGRRGSASHSPLSCVIGLHALDAWEADRPQRRED
ncbi:MAG: hypothetical protein ACRDVL_08700 [Acidimicrobiia bacterium]